MISVFGVRFTMNSIQFITQRAGGDILKQRGYGRAGNESGPLTNLPDFHFTDGTVPPPSKNKRKRIYAQKRAVKRIEEIRQKFPESGQGLKTMIFKGIRKQQKIEKSVDTDKKDLKSLNTDKLETTNAKNSARTE